MFIVTLVLIKQPNDVEDELKKTLQAILSVLEWLKTASTDAEYYSPLQQRFRRWTLL